MTFTPGVNGDYSHPKTHFTAIGSNTDDLEFVQTSHSLELSDVLTEGDCPTAQASNSLRVDTDGVSTYLLNGFNLTMHCDPDQGICNSQAVWPTHFKLAIEEGDGYYDFVFDIERGWTPSNGGGKPLSTSMKYMIEVDVLQIRSNQDTLITKDYLYQNSNTSLFNDPVAQSVVFDLDSDRVNIPAVTGFEFSMLGETGNGGCKNGRYFEHIAMNVAQVSNSEFTAEAALKSPWLTTYKSQYSFDISTKQLQFKRGSVDVVQSSVAGTTCVNDWTQMYYCSWFGMDAKTTDTVPISLKTGQYVIEVSE